MISHSILLVFTAFACIGFDQTSAYCNFSMTDYYGYVCELENVTASNNTDWIDLSGTHIDGRTNAHVNTVIVTQTSMLEEIPIVIFASFFNLEMLQISGNVVRRIDLPFCGPRMRILQVNLNPLTLLQNGAFRGCGTIESLYLIANSIERIEDDVFRDLPLLRDFELFGSPLQEVRDHVFRNQLQLRNVRFDQNVIETIQPGALQCKEFLETLEFRLNKIERIATGTFTNLLRLRTLNLGFNVIEVIEEGAFANLPLLERLDLATNQITVLHSNVFGTTFPNLQHLGFGSNTIHAVDRTVFRRFPALQSFSGLFNVCFSRNFVDIESFEEDVFPHLETCFSNFEDEEL